MYFQRTATFTEEIMRPGLYQTKSLMSQTFASHFKLSKSMMHLQIGHIIFFIVGTPYTSAIPSWSFRGDGRIVSLHFSENWTTAVTTCYNRNETLASIADLKNLDSDIWEQQPLLDEELWTSNTSVYTPFISKIGCYEMEGNYLITATLQGYGTTPIAVCYAYCSGSQYFALLGFNCICNMSSNITEKKSINCGRNDSIGRQKTLELYEVAKADTAGRNSEDIYFKVFECRFVLNELKAISHTVSKSKMSKTEAYYGACFSSEKGVVLLSNSFPDWESADLACSQFTGQPLATQLNDAQCRRFSNTIKNIYQNAMIMTGKRTYHSQILYSDIFDSGALGLVSCKTVSRSRSNSWTDIESPKEVQCNTGKKYFICMKEIDKRTEQGSHIKLMLIILAAVAGLLALIVPIVTYVKCRDMKKSKGANQEKKGRPSFKESDPCLYNHTESSMRISMKKEKYVHTSVSEDSGEESYFSENCVESESQKLNEKVVPTPTTSDDRFASACPNPSLHDMPVDRTVFFLRYVNGTIPQDNGYVP